MPDIRILKALGMTPQQWGMLPPETESPQRNELKRKALEILGVALDVPVAGSMSNVTREELRKFKDFIADEISELRQRILILENGLDAILMDSSEPSSERKIPE